MLSDIENPISANKIGSIVNIDKTDIEAAPAAMLAEIANASPLILLFMVLSIDILYITRLAITNIDTKANNAGRPESRASAK
jgi:hypothetical protein